MPTDGWTYRIGLHNPSKFPVRHVCVRLVAVDPDPSINVLPLTLRMKDNNSHPYTESKGFTVATGASEFVDVVMKSVLIPTMELQHIVYGVTRKFLPPPHLHSILDNASVKSPRSQYISESFSD